MATENDVQATRAASFRGIGSETGGVVLIVLGVAGLFLEPAAVARLLPLLIVYYGVRDLVAPYGGRPPSVLVLAVGVWSLISAYEIFGFDFLNSWPLLIVLVGLSLIIDGLAEGDGDPARQAEGGS